MHVQYLLQLSFDEAQTAFPRRDHQDLSQYVETLRDLEPGQAAGISREGLSDRALKRRLGLAAKDLGYRLRWSRQETGHTVLPARGTACFFGGRRTTTAPLTDGRACNARGTGSAMSAAWPASTLCVGTAAARAPPARPPACR